MRKSVQISDGCILFSWLLLAVNFACSVWRLLIEIHYGNGVYIPMNMKVVNSKVSSPTIFV